jgi:hypothetical protein
MGASQTGDGDEGGTSDEEAHFREAMGLSLHKSPNRQV